MAQINVEYGSEGERLLIENDIATESTLNQLAKNMEGLGGTLKSVMMDLLKQSGKNDEEIKTILGENDPKKIVEVIEEQTDNDNSKLRNNKMLKNLPPIFREVLGIVFHFSEVCYKN